MNEIIKAFLSGKKIRDKEWKAEAYIYKNEQGNIKDERGFTCNGIAIIILTDSESFELYQEPKKAWIDTNEFNQKHWAILSKISCQGRSGAIALAREFIQEYKKTLYSDNGDSLVYRIMSNLIGEENLE